MKTDPKHEDKRIAFERACKALALAEDRKRECRRLWVQACAWDGVSPDSPFLVFSDSNPYIARYNTLMED